MIIHGPTMTSSWTVSLPVIDMDYGSSWVQMVVYEMKQRVKMNVINKNNFVCLFTENCLSTWTNDLWTADGFNRDNNEKGKSDLDWSLTWWATLEALMLNYDQCTHIAKTRTITSFIMTLIFWDNETDLLSTRTILWEFRARTGYADQRSSWTTVGNKHILCIARTKNHWCSTTMKQWWNYGIWL